MEKEICLEVAKALREKVEQYKNEGLPKPILLSEEAMKTLTTKERKFFGTLTALAKEQKRIFREKEERAIESGSPLWDVRRKIQQVLREAIVETDMLRFGVIQRTSIKYGAIPDPETDWKYYRDTDGFYKCWKCGGPVRVKIITDSIHFEEFELGGGEETINQKEVLYCVNCEKEP
jgi:hypothetical protein